MDGDQTPPPSAPASSLDPRTLKDRAVRGASRAVALSRAVLERIWNDERLFLLTVVLVGLFLARRSFRDGIWADNDSVCHYAYLRHLVEEFYPQTGTFLGYSPKFNGGIPFLLYNTPPGLYVLSALVSTILHVSPLAGMKIAVVTGYLSVPILGYAIATTFEGPRSTPKFVALALGLFSSELYGLEFFFRNGMLNPAIAVPFLLATLYFFRRAQLAAAPETFRHLALAGVFFACTVVTHVLSTYMLCLALGAFVLGRGRKNWGHDVLRLGVLLAVGGALSAFWILPSAPFAATEDAAYTWLRRPQDTISSFLDGSLLSSYFAGFFPNFITISNVGIVAIVAGFTGLGVAIQKRATGPLSVFCVFLFGFLVMLGPTWPTVGRILPAYDRLLWYRFLTLAELGWLMLAGYGLAAIASLRPPFRPYNLIALVACLFWAFIVMTQRAVRVETASEYEAFTSDVDRIAEWLRKHGDHRARVFDEFLGESVIQPPSVNYIRHMMPILSGMREIGGWIYENNVAGQILQRKGVFWYDSFPLIDEAPKYGVKYIVAGSPQLNRALDRDPRWRAVVSTMNLVLFENVVYEPMAAEGAGLEGNVTSERYLAGGGYEYVLGLSPAKAPSRGPLVVKVGYLPGFTVLADGVPVTARASTDGLLEVELPPGAAPRTLVCHWDVDALRHKGNLVTAGGAVLVLALLGLSRLERLRTLKLQKALDVLGLAGAVVAIGALAVRARKTDLSPVGFGVREGILPFEDPNELQVGAYDDDRSTSIVHLHPEAWGPRRTLGREPARSLARSDVPAFSASFATRGENHVLLRGEPEGAPVVLTFRAPGSETTLCEVEGHVGAPVPISAACVAGTDDGTLPGITRDVALRATTDASLLLTSIRVDTGIRVKQAEGLKNSIDDGGDEAFYFMGAVEYPAQGGLVMSASAYLDRPIDLVGHVTSNGGRQAVWLLTRTLHDRFRETRADVSVWVDGARVGSSRGEPRGPRVFWERDVTYEWIKLGEVDAAERSDVRLRIEKKKNSVAGLADVDAIAFVPM